MVVSLILASKTKMAPKLYMFHASPPARAILLCERALNIELQHVIIDFFNDEHLQPEFLKINPQHTIPTLVDDDGTVVWDSHAIMAYLAGKYGMNDSLYPQDLKKRALVDQRLHFETGNVFTLLRSIAVPLKEKKTDSVSEERKALVETSYDFLNTFLEGNLWMAGNEITIADFSLISSISSLQFVVPIDSKYANLIAWLKRAETLPYYHVNVKGLQEFKDFLIPLIKK